MNPDNSSYRQQNAEDYAGTCPFCKIIAGQAPADILYEELAATVIAPLNPVTDGHVLVIPPYHVRDAIENPDVTGATMEVAVRYARRVGQCNLITSVGPDATQSVWHLHIHVVPRRPNDGLILPWTLPLIDRSGTADRG